jgi:MFS family permease
MGPACGTILGTTAVLAVTLALTPSAFETWGWRIPLLASVVLLAFGAWLRRGVEETPAFVALRARQATARAPVRDVLAKHKRPMLVSIGVRIGPDVEYALLTVFTITYVTTVLHLPRSLALIATMIGAACHAIAVPLFGALSDRVGRRPVYVAGVLLSVAWVFVYFAFLNTARQPPIVFAVAGGLTLHAMMYGPQAALIAEQFPARVRYAGASLAYTLTGIVAGGFAPLIFAALYKSFGATLPLEIYVAVAFGVTLAALACARETANLPLAV